MYHEIAQDSDSETPRCYLKRDAEWLTALPGKSSGKMITFSNMMPHGVYVEEKRTTAHALYAYPLAAAALVAVDVPVALLCTALEILTLPYEMMK